MTAPARKPAPTPHPQPPCQCTWTGPFAAMDFMVATLVGKGAAAAGLSWLAGRASDSVLATAALKMLMRHSFHASASIKETMQTLVRSATSSLDLRQPYLTSAARRHRCAR